MIEKACMRHTPRDAAHHHLGGHVQGGDTIAQAGGVRHGAGHRRQRQRRGSRHGGEHDAPNLIGTRQQRQPERVGGKSDIQDLSEDWDERQAIRFGERLGFGTLRVGGDGTEVFQWEKEIRKRQRRKRLLLHVPL